MNKTLKIARTLYRAARAEIAAIPKEDGAAQGGEMISVSSDVPYLREDWGGDLYWEVLDHTPEGLDSSRLTAGLPFLFNHDRNQHIARAGSFVNDGHKISLCMDDFKWAAGQFAAEKRMDIESGALPDTSVGYEITDDGECIGEVDGVPVYKFKWTIFEASAVTIPADITVGSGRHKSTGSDPAKEISIKYLAHNKPNTQTKTMPETIPAEVTEAPVIEQVIEPAIVAELEPVASAEEVRAEGVKLERARVLELTQWARDVSKLRKIDLSEAVSDHVATGKSLLELKEFVFTNEFKSAPLPIASETSNSKGMSRADFSKMSAHNQSEYCRNGGRLVD